MFTGIITDKGLIKNIERNGDTRLQITTSYDMRTVEYGASIACSGICLTVVEKDKNSFAVDVSDETLSCTTIGSWKVGTEINLERPLKLGDELGGHIVSGHVDGLAEVINVNEAGGSHVVTFQVPDKLKYFMAPKGSVALDGISLTVNKVDDNIFTINIIPHTWEKTTMQDLRQGSRVNLEIDTMARYVARMNERK